MAHVVPNLQPGNLVLFCSLCIHQQHTTTAATTVHHDVPGMLFIFEVNRVALYNHHRWFLSLSAYPPGGDHARGHELIISLQHVNMNIAAAYGSGRKGRRGGEHIQQLLVFMSPSSFIAVAQVGPGIPLPGRSQQLFPYPSCGNQQ